MNTAAAGINGEARRVRGGMNRNRVLLDLPMPSSAKFLEGLKSPDD